jgi:hypothetical protein
MRGQLKPKYLVSTRTWVLISVGYLAVCLGGYLIALAQHWTFLTEGSRPFIIVLVGAPYWLFVFLILEALDLHVWERDSPAGVQRFRDAAGTIPYEPPR